jgi:hypothetical protein
LLTIIIKVLAKAEGRVLTRCRLAIALCTIGFAIMADTISIEGNGLLRIRIGQDYASAGLPDLPQAQEIVFLNE